MHMRSVISANSACPMNPFRVNVKAKDRSNESYQMFWRALGKFNRKTLVRSLMEARAEDSEALKRTPSSEWILIGMDPNQYPN